MIKIIIQEFLPGPKDKDLHIERAHQLPTVNEKGPMLKHTIKKIRTLRTKRRF